MRTILLRSKAHLAEFYKANRKNKKFPFDNFVCLKVVANGYELTLKV